MTPRSVRVANKVVVSVLSLSAVGLVACGSADYSGTQFQCDELDPVCPAGMECLAGVCAGPGDGPAGPGADAAATSTPADAAAGPAADADLPSHDAATQDAGPPRTVSFGERPGADVTGVTFDTFIDASDQRSNRGDGGDILIDASPEKISLVRFDISAIPLGATVVSAQMIVQIFDSLDSGDLVAHPLLLLWLEADADYGERIDDTPWPEPGAGGASYDAATLAASFAPRATGEYTVDIAPAVVQAWVDSPATNYGLRWMSTSPDGRGGGWDSSEFTPAATRPVLIVTYQP